MRGVEKQNSTAVPSFQRSLESFWNRARNPLCEGFFGLSFCRRGGCLEEIERKTSAVRDHGALHQSDKLPANRTKVIERVDNGLRGIVCILENPFAIAQVSCELDIRRRLRQISISPLGQSMILRKNVQRCVEIRTLTPNSTIAPKIITVNRVAEKIAAGCNLKNPARLIFCCNYRICFSFFPVRGGVGERQML